MSKRLKKLAIIALTGAMVSSFGVTAYAGTTDKANTPVNGTHTAFDKYLVLDREAFVPNYTSTYTVSAGPAVAGTETTPEVYAGISAERVHITQKAPFKPGQKTFSSVQSDDTVTLDAGEKYAVQPVDVDFSGVTFTQPGIYRYLVCEADRSDQGITIDPDDDRYLDVYVESAEDGQLSIVAYVLHDDVEETLADEPEYQVVPQTQVNNHYNYYVMNSPGNPSMGYHISTPEEKADPSVKKYTAVVTGKDAGFENMYTTYDLSLEKEVTGNQGNREEYFEFTVNFSGGVPNTRYKVDLSEATESGINYTMNGTQSTTKSNIAQLSVAADGEDLQGDYYFATDGEGRKTLTFYLKDDQKVMIYGITSATKYAVTETKKAGEGYTESYEITTGSAAPSKSVTSNVLEPTFMGEHDTDIEFTNYRNGIVPTGVMVPVTPFAIATVCAGLGTVVFGMKKKKH